MRFFSYLIRVFSKPAKGWFYLFVFLLNLVSNYVVIIDDDLPFTYFSVFFLSAFAAYMESIVYVLIKNKWVRKTYVVLITLLHSIFIVCEYFLVIKYGLFLNQSLINIIGETNRKEVLSFIHTYLSPLQILTYLGILVVFLAVVYGMSVLMSRVRYAVVAFMCSLVGLGFVIYCCYGFVRFRDGMAIPQHTSITRVCYCIYQLKEKNSNLVLLREACKNVVVNQDTLRPPTIVVIIGESHSVYHSSLYGYAKKTNPLLEKRVADGSMMVFDNAVTLFDVTSSTMAADFSLDSLGVDFATTPLFPACFKAAGYRTMMYENQYFIGSGISFLCDQDLSDILFDYRNDMRYVYDGDMVEAIEMTEQPSLYVIHLQGQHFEYEYDYPKTKMFTRFTAGDYDSKYNEEQRQTMAHYDNATLYNDYVIDKILDKFKDTYSCVFYFSDHGEEVYELRNYSGHCNAETSPDLNYQIRIPLLVWMSPEFVANNQSIKQKMEKAKHYPICADDIGHTLLDVAGIKTVSFAPSRSFVNNKFNKKRHRVVLHSVDYDEYQATH